METEIHRPPDVPVPVDRIVFLDEGRIRDVGSHDTLMSNTNSAYREFVELQGQGCPGVSVREAL